jgi:hypothetical protein
LGAEKTNYQYWQAFNDRFPAESHPLASLIRTYEYIWYGEYAVPVEDFSSILIQFKQFNQKDFTS